MNNFPNSNTKVTKEIVGDVETKSRDKPCVHIKADELE